MDNELVDPLIYICTKQEFTKLQHSRENKNQFDRTILEITGNTERAKQFFRNYFRRVEQANMLFSSYKEGWKTDRGMMYIIFGLPDEVYRFTDREVWRYQKNFNFQCQFTRSGTLFDPDNYVLLRNKKLKDTWLETVDLWRKARY